MEQKKNVEFLAGGGGSLNFKQKQGKSLFLRGEPLFFGGRLMFYGSLQESMQYHGILQG